MHLNIVAWIYVLCAVHGTCMEARPPAQAWGRPTATHGTHHVRGCERVIGDGVAQGGEWWING